MSHILVKKHIYNKNKKNKQKSDNTPQIHNNKNGRRGKRKIRARRLSSNNNKILTKKLRKKIKCN